jgi:hypothetical protein
MRPRERREPTEQDPFCSRLDQIIDMKPALVKLARAIDWGFLEQTLVYTDKPGQPQRHCGREVDEQPYLTQLRAVQAERRYIRCRYMG